MLRASFRLKCVRPTFPLRGAALNESFHIYSKPQQGRVTWSGLILIQASSAAQGRGKVAIL
jgi:hypothetical protein